MQENYRVPPGTADDLFCRCVLYRRRNIRRNGYRDRHRECHGIGNRRCDRSGDRHGAWFGVGKRDPAVKENVPTSGASVTFYHNENNSLFLTAEGLDAAVTEDAEVGTVLSLRAAGGSEHTLTLNYGEYVRAHGLEPATVGGTQYVILRFRVENGDAASLRLGTATEAGATSRPLAGAYDPADAGWQSVLYAVGNFKWAGKRSDGDAFAGITLSLFRSAPAQGETVHLYSVTLTSDLPTALAALGYTDQLLGGGDTSGVVWNDPVRHVRLTAPDEDESVALWFDHITEKTLQTTVTPTDKAGYTVRLALNEI